MKTVEVNWKGQIFLAVISPFTTALKCKIMRILQGSNTSSRIKFKDFSRTFLNFKDLIYFF